MVDRYYTTGGDGDWSNTNNWSATSGGGSGETIPSTNDNVFLDANSGTNLVVNSTTRACAKLDCTGYTGTLTFDVDLQTNNSIILVVAMTLAGTAKLIADETATSSAKFTSNGKEINVEMQWGGASGGIFTLLDDWVFTGGLVVSRLDDSSISTFNGFSMEAKGCDLKIGNGSGPTSGTTLFKCTGTGDLIGGGTVTGGHDFGSPLEFVSGTRTLKGGMPLGGGGSFTYTSGTVIIDSSLEIAFAKIGTFNFDIGTASHVIPQITVATSNMIFKFTNTGHQTTFTDMHVNGGAIFTIDNSGNDNPLRIISFGDQLVSHSGNMFWIGDVTFVEWYTEYSSSGLPVWEFDHTATYIWEERFEVLILDTGNPRFQSDHDTLQTTFHIWHNCRVHLYGMATKNIDARSVGQGMVVQGETTHTGSNGVSQESINVVVKGLNGTTPIDHPFYQDPVFDPKTISGTTQLSASDQVDTIVIVITKTLENGIDWYKLTDVLVTDVNGDWSTTVPNGTTVFVECHYDDGTKYNSESHAFIDAS